MAEPPEDSLSFAKRMFGRDLFPKDDPRHEWWEKTCQIWAEKNARLTAELLEKHPNNLLPFVLELVTGHFNIGAECILPFKVCNYETAALYEQLLGELRDSHLSFALEHCSRGIEKNELRSELKLRLTGRMAHWMAEALRLARESQVKRPAASASLDVNRTLQQGQQALERWAATRDSLRNEATDSGRQGLPTADQQNLPASGDVGTLSNTAPPGESIAESGAEKLAGLAEAQSDIAPEEKPLSPRLEKARRCHKIIEEVERIKFLFVRTGKSMSQIQAEHPEFEVWGLVQNLDEEYRDVFYRPRTWGPTVGFAKILLSKDYEKSEHTITDWIKDYRRHLKSKNSPR